MQIVPKLIGITGGSCSGKTTLSKSLAAQFGDQLTLVSFDDLFVGHAAIDGKQITDWEDPNLYRWDELIRCLKELKAGHTVTLLANESPERRVPEYIHIEPRPIILISGFLALHSPEVRELLDVSIYLDVPEKEIIRRRLARAVSGDYWDSKEYVTKNLIEGHRRVVLPQRAVANYILDGELSPDELADEATRILKS